jgi:ribosomal protein L44E
MAAPNFLIQCSHGLSTGWTRSRTLVTIRGMPGEFHIDKLSDEFGQYTLVLKCSACGHERTAEPHTLGRLCGWDARLEDVAKRMRCSKCGKKRCALRAFPAKKPRGYTSLPK